MKKINWYEPEINKFNYNILKSTIKSNFISEGKITSNLEKKISKFLNIDNVIMTSSGTSALYLALRAINVSSKDEIIVPNITYAATLNAVKMTGAVPILVDVDQKTSTIDIKNLKKNISRKTKAIIFVHISGRFGNIKKILSFARKKKIKLIEDAAEAFGSNFNNKKLGTLGDLGCFSFTPTKIITSAQGGAVVSKNKKFINLIRCMKDQGRTKKNIGGDDDHNLFGGNYKYNDILASLLIPQFKNIKKQLKKADEINNFYRKNLKGVKEVSFYEKKKGEVCIWTEIKTTKRNKLHNYLLKKNIKCRKIWKPLSTFKINKKNKKFKNSEIVYNNTLWLPSSLTLAKKDLKKICRFIKIFFKKKN